MFDIIHSSFESNRNFFRVLFSDQKRIFCSSYPQILWLNLRALTCSLACSCLEFLRLHRHSKRSENSIVLLSVTEIACICRCTTPQTICPSKQKIGYFVLFIDWDNPTPKAPPPMNRMNPSLALALAGLPPAGVARGSGHEVDLMDVYPSAPGSNLLRVATAKGCPGLGRQQGLTLTTMRADIDNDRLGYHCRDLRFFFSAYGTPAGCPGCGRHGGRREVLPCRGCPL